ncbi:hypothetical protein LCGC14_0276040 [marine sediment metagenome]|uniref:Uncharacterized protein n=1 Tax=marine sediment metagenome TaxID=412755 RepID=A0A0F9UEN5_9ZZZZ
MTTRETRELTATETKLIELLTTSTGSAMMDSGGIPQYDADGKYTGSIHGYGRAHERNQGRTFVDKPETSLHFSSWYTNREGKDGWKTEHSGDMEFSVSVFHYLNRYLDYDKSLDGFYGWYLDEIKKDKDDPHTTDVEDFIQWMRDSDFEIGGLYGDNEAAWSGNTYNGECNLTQTLQYWLLSVNEVPEEYEERLPCPSFYMLILQIHQGADVRGGYTAPTVFTANQYDIDSFFGFSDGEIYCNGCEAHWSTDDGYYWYEDGSSGGYKVLDLPAHTKALAALKDVRQKQIKIHAELWPRLQSQGMAAWMRSNRSYALEYRSLFDELEAVRRGDPELGEVILKLSNIAPIFLQVDTASNILKRLIESAAQALATPICRKLVSSEREEAQNMMDAVAKRPHVQLDKCTFVELHDIEEHDDLKQSLNEYMNNPIVPEPVSDEQTTYLEDDSDIRDSRNHPRNKQDIKGWAVTHGYVLIDEDHNGHCPFCGDKLKGGF